MTHEKGEQEDMHEEKRKITATEYFDINRGARAAEHAYMEFMCHIEDDWRAGKKVSKERWDIADKLKQTWFDIEKKLFECEVTT